MQQRKIRKPCVAGQFYPAQPEELIRQIRSFTRKAQAQEALGCILPHAGYVYSGRVAVETLESVKLKGTIILLGPNHTGRGAAFSIMTSGVWQTPLGEVEINRPLAKLFLAGSKFLQEDDLAHQQEHSLEVELPILQFFRKDFKIVPVALMTDNPDALRALAQEMAGVIKNNHYADSLSIIASSDMTHYEPLSSAEKKDNLAIKAILDLDALRLMSNIAEFDISMCGYAPVFVLLHLAKLLGATRGKLINYETSAQVTRETTSVVGYAGITIN